MAINTHFKVGGTFRSLSKIHIKAAGVWKECSKVWFKDAGVWKEVFTNVIAGIINPIPITEISDDKLSPADANASIYFNADGTFTFQGNGTVCGSHWYTPTTAAIGNSYWVKLTVNSGSSPNLGGLTAGTAYQISATRRYGLAQTISGVKSGNWMFQLATDAAFTNIVATVTTTVVVLVEV